MEISIEVHWERDVWDEGVMERLNKVLPALLEDFITELRSELAVKYPIGVGGIVLHMYNNPVQ